MEIEFNSWDIFKVKFGFGVWQQVLQALHLGSSSRGERKNQVKLSNER